MRNRVPAVALSAALVLGLTLLAVPTAAASGKDSASTSGKVTTLAATLKGANEVPGPGDPDGRGRAVVALAARIAARPSSWYVNIHPADFPAGAIRGQLHRARHLDLDLPHQLAARLIGANEVPGPGDPDGRGLALVRTGHERVCFALAWTGIAPPIFAHIHSGPAGVAGPVVVLFFDVPELPGAPTAALPDTISAAAG